jgi:hypothetical protein
MCSILLTEDEVISKFAAAVKQLRNGLEGPHVETTLQSLSQNNAELQAQRMPCTWVAEEEIIFSPVAPSGVQVR